MTWTRDARGSAVAAALFPGCRPTVRRDGKHLLVEGTPYGRLEFLSLGDRRYLAAAEHPPDGAGEVPNPVDDTLRQYLDRNRLRPWRVVQGSGPEDLLLRLVEDPGPADAPAESASPLFLEMDSPAEIVGDDRRRIVEILAGLLRAERPGSPLPVLVGPPGAGRRTLAAAAAAALGLRPIELPLRRVLIDRVFQTAHEAFLDALLTAEAHLAEGCVVAVTDAEMLRGVRDGRGRQMMAELARLRAPKRVLLAAQTPYGGDLVPLACPGLATPDDVRRLVALHHPELCPEAATLEMVSRAARDPAAGGIVPGRVLFVVRLALGLASEAGAAATSLPPDEAAMAIRLARLAWGEPSHEDPGGRDD